MIILIFNKILACSNKLSNIRPLKMGIMIMTRLPATKSTLLLLASLLVVLTVLASGCADECDSNVDCANGQYCDTGKGVCTLDCRLGADCPSGKCSSLGKCVPGTTSDSGPREAGPDKTVPDTGTGVDKGPLDQWPAKDVKIPDKYVKPDLKPDMLIIKDQWVGEGPKPDMPDSGTVVPGLWTTIKTGKFFMGSPTNETCRDKTNETQHEVTLNNKFQISTTEVTQAQFKQVMNYNPSNATSCGTNCPVEMVSWHEAVAYCNALSKLAGLTECYSCSGKLSKVVCAENSSYLGANIYSCKGYRLPTEAEWEYAARAGQFTALYNGKLSTCTGIDANANAIAWYNMNSKATPHPVSQKQANSWGLYDMAGNILEWVNDWYKVDLGSSSVSDPGGPTSGSQRVIRGGSWLLTASYLRAASRLSVAPSGRTKYAGFRCARLIP